MPPPGAHHAPEYVSPSRALGIPRRPSHSASLRGPWYWPPRNDNQIGASSRSFSLWSHHRTCRPYHVIPMPAKRAEETPRLVTRQAPSGRAARSRGCRTERPHGDSSSALPLRFASGTMVLATSECHSVWASGALILLREVLR